MVVIVSIGNPRGGGMEAITLECKRWIEGAPAFFTGHRFQAELVGDALTVKPSPEGPPLETYFTEEKIAYYGKEGVKVTIIRKQNGDTATA